MRALAVDPGREKCGLAVVEGTKKILDRAITPTSNLEASVAKLISKWEPETVLLGNGTFSKIVRERLKATLNHTPLVVINERNSTYLARKLYFQYKPPKGIWRFIPLGLQVPPEPYDDFAAAFMAMRYFQEEKS